MAKTTFDIQKITFTGGLIMCLSVLGLAWLKMQGVTTKVNLLAHRQGKIAIELAKVSQKYKTMELALDELFSPLPLSEDTVVSGPPVVLVDEDLEVNEEDRPA